MPPSGETEHMHQKEKKKGKKATALNVTYIQSFTFNMIVFKIKTSHPCIILLSYFSKRRQPTVMIQTIQIRFWHDRVSRTRTSPQLVALLRQSFSVTNCLYKNKRNKRKAEALHTASGKTLTTKFPQPAQMLTPGTTT